MLEVLVFCIAMAVAALALLAWYLAQGTRNPKRTVVWLRALFGAIALASGVWVYSQNDVEVRSDWIQPLGSIALADGAELTGSFDVSHRVGVWFVLDGAVDPLNEILVSWTVRSGTERIATGGGGPVERDSPYREESEALSSFGPLWEVKPGRSYELSFQVLRSPGAVGPDAATAVVQVRADSLVFKNELALVWTTTSIALSLAAAGFVLLAWSTFTLVRQRSPQLSRTVSGPKSHS